MTLHIWRHFGFMLPDDWEMLQFSRSPDKGRCAFADRYSYRFELNWRRVDGPPDTERMLSDYLARLAEEGMENGKRSDVAGWAGLVGSKDGRTFTRFGAYMQDEGCLVEIVFIWPGQRDRQQEEGVLRGFHVVAAEAGGCRHWRAFGMDLKSPAGAVLQSCAVRAAMAEMTFADKRGRTVGRFGRRGLVSDWQREPVDAWLGRWVSGEMRVETRHSVEAGNGHHVHRVRGWSLRRGIVQRRRPCRAEAWLCPADKRLYSWLTIGEEEAPTVRALICCREVEHGNG